MSLVNPKREGQIQQPEMKWTPRAIKVLATARAIAAPANIKAEHLFLALEAVAVVTGDHPASRALARLGISASAALGKPIPDSCPPNHFASWEVFDPSVSAVFPATAINEAKMIGHDYVGTEHLLLFLARVGVPGVDLPYERLRTTVIELQKES
jgi:hypothetical protein